VKTASGAFAHLDLKVGLSPLVFFVVGVIQVGPMQDELDRFANVVDVCIETNALEVDLHAADVAVE